MGNPYLEKYRKAIQNSKTNTEIEGIIDKVYSDGFEDGYGEKE